MEKDSFDEKLQQMVLQSDLLHSHSSSKERVWAQINKPRKQKKRWYYAAAACLLLAIAFGILSLPKEETKLNPMVKRLKKPSAKAAVERPMLAIQPVLKKPVFKKISTKIGVDTAIAPSVSDKPNVIENLKSPEIALNTNPPIVQTKPVATTEEPEFTVQFKRGTIAATTAIPATRTVFKKFGFKKDSLYYANNENTHKIPFKIKF